MAYFERVGESAFRATEHVGGAWDTEEQHIAPALGLLAHVVELDRDARRDDGLVVCRLSWDILGTVPVDVVSTSVRVLRPGRTIELVEARMGHGGRDAVCLRAWLMKPGETGHLRATSLPRIAPPEDMPSWDPSTVWPGGFIETAEVRRAEVEPGRASFWVRTPLPLVEGEPVSALAGAAGLFDIANGMTVRADPRHVAFPNVDLTAHLFSPPEGEWIGFDTTVSFGAAGLGLTSSVIHDVGGPIGTMAQMLTVRPR
ncbi:Thioesterase-like superfamily protein [Pedococcus cremeus]|uniref:Thioesterase-like superfamily protein n=1 Tax=Pedococcus cremeus TaxID=587636 RepID=A0A1H9V3A7_9MICO|nr:thioesterase family protein [Pedococcus cremeus]SES16041.1 Thioesterase-like superfamily protein [Pedococcus cremeus]